ncbi:MAG: O-acetyl-ADP-ribose deacetylase [Lewinellaceae bacterium]|jgi:O-acetyl-ADP-ribose deacetylase (regulator of RNase III)|nr:O-acetyl-ADP-ribose deacetylase [Lewinellaceae bacterium]
MDTKITVVRGDITKITTDAIVNAANSSLLGGGGVDGAIHRAGGPQILEDCMRIRARQGGCPTGEAVITTGGKLPARYVIHTVGPVYRDGTQGEPELLASCYRNVLRLAIENGLKTVAFPNISTGIYGYPKAEAAAVAIQTTKAYIAENQGSLEEISFVCFDEENYALYCERLSDD